MKKLKIQSAFTKWQFLTTINCGFVNCGDTITLNKVFDGQNKHFLKRLKKYNLQIKSEKTYLIYKCPWSLKIFFEHFFNSKNMFKNWKWKYNVNWLSVVFISCLSQFFRLGFKIGCSHIQMVRLLNPWVVLMI